MAIVNIHEAKTHLSALLDKAQKGEEIVIAKAGRPIARLVPIAQKGGKRPRGVIKGRVTEAFFEPLPDDMIDAIYK